LALRLGYSFFSNQYGLASDTVKAFELVKPDGKVVKVTNESDSELFFGLRVSKLPFVFISVILIRGSGRLQQLRA
jgi:FAD/FMN-containing dehydrogenase